LQTTMAVVMIYMCRWAHPKPTQMYSLPSLLPHTPRHTNTCAHMPRTQTHTHTHPHTQTHTRTHPRTQANMHTHTPRPTCRAVQSCASTTEARPGSASSSSPTMSARSHRAAACRAVSKLLALRKSMPGTCVVIGCAGGVVR